MNINTTKIYKHDTKNFTKNGKLSKRAKPVLVFTGVEKKRIAEIIRQDIKDIAAIETPYIFTYIRLVTRDSNYLVFEDVTFNGNTLMTSPTKLLEELKK